MVTRVSTVALIGLGEVGRVFAEDLQRIGSTDVVAWDTAFALADSTASRNASACDVRIAASALDAVRGAELVVCAVTAAHCVAAARSAADGLSAGVWFVDLNSSSPAHKQAAAAAVEAAGGRYVEAALMSAIGAQRLAAPFLLGGPHAQEFATEATRWGLSNATAYSTEVGRAAATKLCRSVIVKGLESLLTESMLAARHYGVEREVLDSLPNILPPADWQQVAAYFMSRSLQHGQRRSEEMQEAAATVADAGVTPWMSEASVLRQRWAAQFPNAKDDTDLFAMVDAVRRAAALEGNRA